MEAVYLGNIPLDPRCDKEHQIHWFLWAAENSAYSEKCPVILEINEESIEAQFIREDVPASLTHSIMTIVSLREKHRPDGDIFSYYRATGPVDVCPIELHVFRLLDAANVKVLYSKLDSHLHRLRGEKGLSVDSSFLTTGKSVEGLHTLWRSGNHIFEAMHICGYELQSTASLDSMNFDVQVSNFYFRSLSSNRRSLIRATPSPLGLMQLLGNSDIATDSLEGSASGNEPSQVTLVDISLRSVTIVDPRRKIVLLDALFRNVLRLFKGLAYPDHIGLLIAPGPDKKPFNSQFSSSSRSTNILHIFRCSNNQLCNDVYNLLSQSLVLHDLACRLCSSCPIKLWNDMCLQLNEAVKDHGSVFFKSFLNEMHTVLLSFVNKSLTETLEDGTTLPVSQQEFTTDIELCATLFQNVYNIIRKMQEEHREHQERYGIGQVMVDNVLSWAKRSFAIPVTTRQSLSHNKGRRRSSTLDESELSRLQLQRFALRASSIVEPTELTPRASRSVSVVGNYLPRSTSMESVRRKFSYLTSPVTIVDSLEEQPSNGDKEARRKSRVQWTVRDDSSDKDMEVWSMESRESGSMLSDESPPVIPVLQAAKSTSIPLRVRIYQSLIVPTPPREESSPPRNPLQLEKESKPGNSHEKVVEKWKSTVHEVITQQRAYKAFKPSHGQRKISNITLYSVSGQIQLFQVVDDLVFLSQENRHRSVTVWDDILNNRLTPRASTNSLSTAVSSNAENSRSTLQACQDGVPAAMRNLIWPHLIKVSARRQHFVKWSNRSSVNGEQDALRLAMEGVENNYERLLYALTPHQHAILIDVGRTFPQQKYFKFDGSGQMSLFNLLKAYSLADSEVGYCQGLSFIGGILLLHMEEEAAFQCFLQMMFALNLRELFLPSMQHVQRCFYQLSRILNNRCPKLFELFEKHEIPCTLYASSWFLSLFATQFPLPFVIRVYDLILYFGEEAIFRVGYLLMKYNEPFILERGDSFDDVCHYLRVCVPDMGIEVQRQIIKEAFQLSLADELQVYHLEYCVMNEAEALFQENHRVNLRREFTRFTHNNSSKVACLEAAVESLQQELERRQRQNERLEDQLRCLIDRVDNSSSTSPLTMQQIKRELQNILNIA